MQKKSKYMFWSIIKKKLLCPKYRNSRKSVLLGSSFCFVEGVRFYNFRNVTVARWSAIGKGVESKGLIHPYFQADTTCFMDSVWFHYLNSISVLDASLQCLVI